MPQAILTVDLGFGDAGKGSIVDFLTREYDAHTVVRYNGGAQAGHRVVTAGPHKQEHIFAQWGSGTLAGAATHLSRFMLLDPLAMVAEADHLRQLGIAAWEQLTIDEGALVITPFQRAINRLRELARDGGRHGSCGMGIGETMSDYLAHGERVLFAGDLADPTKLVTKLQFLHTVNLAKLRELQPTLPSTEQVAHELELLTDNDWQTWLVDAYHDIAHRARIVPPTYLHTLLRRPGTVIFEGAQGVLLDEWHGFHPYTTWSTTTLANADTLLREADYNGATTRVGLTRAYATRHGAGPLVTEDAELTRMLPDPCNGFGAWQQGFRVGWLDLVMVRYALDIVGSLDYLAVTCLDRLADLSALHVCHRYQYDTFTIDRIVPAPTHAVLHYQEQITQSLARCQPLYTLVADVMALIKLVSAELGIPVQILAYGPTSEDKQVYMSNTDPTLLHYTNK